MTKFVDGELVECVVPSDCFGLHARGMYHVAKQHKEIVTLDGFRAAVYASRFRRVQDFQVGDVVLCVDNTKVTALLTVGKSYTVVDVRDHYVRVLDDGGVLTLFQPMRFGLKERAPACPTGDEPKIPPASDTPPKRSFEGARAIVESMYREQQLDALRRVLEEAFGVTPVVTQTVAFEPITD